MYRYLLELKGHKVKAMKLQMNIRDAGTFTAIARGVDKNIYFVNIPVVDNDEIVSYFTVKRDELLKHDLPEESLTDDVEMLLVFAARSQHVTQKILPALDLIRALVDYINTII